MGGFRAKDADRERYVDVIETAYVDGQLGDADRELRVSRALTAETLDELEALTRDLQNRPAPVVVEPAPAPAPARPARPPAPRAGGAGKVVGLAVSAGVALVFIGATSSMHSAQEDWASSTDYAEVPWEQAEADDGHLLTAAQVRTFLRRYEAKFHTTEAYEVGFFPHRVNVSVPVRGSRPRFEQWSWDGDWEREAGPARADGTAGLVDLTTLDVRTLFDNVEVAEQDLGVVGGELSRVLVQGASKGEAVVTIHVHNGYQDTAALVTTTDGRVTRSEPHEP